MLTGLSLVAVGEGLLILTWSDVCFFVFFWSKYQFSVTYNVRLLYILLLSNEKVLIKSHLKKNKTFFHEVVLSF